MRRAKTTQAGTTQRRSRPALTPDARENQIIAKAIDLAEQQIMDGIASSQVITHFLKLGSTLARLEKERLEEENKLLRAKTEAIESGKDIKSLYENALKAMKSYAGGGGADDED